MHLSTADAARVNALVETRFTTCNARELRALSEPALRALALLCSRSVDAPPKAVDDIVALVLHAKADLAGMAPVVPVVPVVPAAPTAPTARPPPLPPPPPSPQSRRGGRHGGARPMRPVVPLNGTATAAPTHERQ